MTADRNPQTAPGAVPDTTSWSNESDAKQTIGRLESEALRKLADDLAGSMGPQLGDPIFAAAVRALAEGQPVSADALGRTLGLSVETVTARLAATPDLETDESGRVVGAGLTLRPTSHRVRLRGRTLYTWCAFDLLLLPQLLGESLEAETADPVTGTAIRLVVSPERVESVAPARTVAAVVIPDAAAVCCGVRGAFCDHAHFFTSETAAAGWLEGRGMAKHGRTLSLDDAFTVAHLLALRAGMVANREAPLSTGTKAQPGRP